MSCVDEAPEAVCCHGRRDEDMNEFKFENTLTLTESQYVAIWSLLPTRRLSQVIRVVALTVVGIVFLFTIYTLLLGVILLSLIVMSVLLPGRILPVGTRSSFRRHKYLRDAMTYGISEQRLWVNSASMAARAFRSMRFAMGI